MSALLRQSSGKCPCCWDPSASGSCSADCIPFSFSSGGVATALDGAYSTCRSNAASLPSWAQPTHTPKKKSGWSTGVYATTAQTANGCTFYFLQYCRDNAAGTNGRSWQVEYFCSGDGGTTVKHQETEVLDWSCTCAGARYAFSFTGAVADDYGCCLSSSTVTACGCAGMPETVVCTLGGCLAADVTLTWNNPDLPISTDNWSGTAVIGGCCVRVYLGCNDSSAHTFSLTCYFYGSATGGVCDGSSFIGTAGTDGIIHTGCDLFPISGNIHVGLSFPGCGACPSTPPIYDIPFALAI